MKLEKLFKNQVLIGIGPIRLILHDGRSVVFGSSGKMYGLTDGSLHLTGPRRIVGKSKRNVEGGATVKSVIYHRPKTAKQLNRAASSPSRRIKRKN